MNPTDLFEKLVSLVDPSSQDDFLCQIESENPEVAQTLRKMLANFTPDDFFLETPAVEQIAHYGYPNVLLDSLQLQLDETKWYDAEGLSLDFLAPPSAPNSLGNLLTYEIHEVIGHGGSGIIFRARDPSLDKWFAIKVIRPDQVEDSIARKRFLKEARTLAKIDHKNIVRIYRAEESPLPFLVMEMVEGHTLDQAIASTKGIPLDQVLSIAIQVAQGLAAAHEQGVVHRDIKPSNILLTDADPSLAKLTDFGLARTPTDLRLTKTGTVVGTPWYMSPEQIRDETIDCRSDLFSLGCVVYEMLCGQKPFTGANPYFVLNAITDNAPGDTLDARQDLPPSIKTVVKKLLQKDPVDRFQSTTELLNALGGLSRSLLTTNERDRRISEALLQKIVCGSMDEATEGQPICRFYDVKIIGLGTSSVVFSALDRSRNSELVAIKMLRPSKADDNIARVRFLAEASHLSKLNHPCIVKVYDSGVINFIPFMVEFFANQGSLEKFINQAPDRFQPDQVAWIISKLADALHAVHSSGLLHRDVKPSNILFQSLDTPDKIGLSILPVLSDFGVSRQLSNDTAERLTNYEFFVGTVAYMPPEQLLGRKLTTQSDIFSLGIVFHELLYGKHPFLVENDHQTHRNIVECNPNIPNSVGKEIPKALSDIAKKCIRRFPDDRYQSAKDLSEDLEKYIFNNRLSDNRLRGLRLPRLSAVICWLISIILMISTVSLLFLSFDENKQRAQHMHAELKRNDSLASGGNPVQLEFVSIGDPGNPPNTADGTPYQAGRVDYLYGISKFEVSRDMVTKFNASQNSWITMSDMTSLGGNDPQKPATGVSWNDAARFVNWLNTSTGGFAAYKFTTDGINDNFDVWTKHDKDDYDPMNPYRSKRAKYVLPSFNEWYKAAYYDPVKRVYFEYTNGSNTPPKPVAIGSDGDTAVYGGQSGPAEVKQAGGLNPFGVMGLGGNVFEWEESPFDPTNYNRHASRGLRGGNWGDSSVYLSSSSRLSYSPDFKAADVGFRVVYLPPAIPKTP